MSRITCLTLATILCSCSTKNNRDFTIQEGPWTATLISVDDACQMGLADNVGDTNDYIIELVDDGDAFTVTPDTSDSGQMDPDFTCTLEDNDFVCEPEGEAGDTMDWRDSGVDAIVQSTYTFSGDFSSETTGTFNIEIQLTCEGSQCGEMAESMEVGSFPCASTQAFSTSAG